MDIKKLFGRIGTFLKSRKVIYLGGIITGLVLVRLLSSLSGDEILYEDSVKSPQGNYVAIVYTSMGGGAAGYCISVVSVIPTKKFDEFKSGKYTVASGHCSSNNVVIEWVNDDTLHIGNFGDVYQRKQENSDKSKKIIYQ